MIRIGERVPHVRVPALANGTLTYFDWTQYRNRWLVLCSVPKLGVIDSIFLDHHASAFANYDAALIALCPEEGPLHHPGIRQLGALRIPILADPLRRLCRTYGILTQERQGRSQTFLIDPDHVLRFQVVQDLNGRGINAILELLSATQAQGLRLFERSESARVTTPQAVSRL